MTRSQSAGLAGLLVAVSMVSGCAGHGPSTQEVVASPSASAGRYLTVVTGTSQAPIPTNCQLLGYYDGDTTVILLHDIVAGTHVRLAATDGMHTVRRLISFPGSDGEGFDRKVHLPMRVIHARIDAWGGPGAVPSHAVMHTSDFVEVTGPNCELD